MYRIPIAIFKDDDNDTYGVVVPAVPGCFPVGESIDDAIEDSKQAICFHLECMMDENMSFNLSNILPIEELKTRPEFKDVLCWAIVEIEEKNFSTKQIRFNVSWPEYLVERVDNYAYSRHDTRSGFLAKAAINMMKEMKTSMNN